MTLAVGSVLTQPIYSTFIFPLLKYMPFAPYALPILGHKKPFRRFQFPEHFQRKISPTQARLVLDQIGNVDIHMTQRRHLAKIYRDGLSNIYSVSLPKEDANDIYLSFPISVENREKLVAYMVQRGRDIGSFYYQNLAESSCFSDFAADCPAARDASKSTLLLPIYPGYKDQEAIANIGVIRDYFQHCHVEKSN